MLEIKELYKSFGEKKVLNGVNLVVPENKIFGFVGKNGAGKTTTMKIALGLMKPDKGEVYVCGEKVNYGGTKTNNYIGYLPDVPEFYNYMTAREYLIFSGKISEMDIADCKKRSDELLELVGLADEKHRIRGFSRGMKQRLGIAQALLKRPKLLICDEPTSALDPEGRKNILDIITLAAKNDNTSVIFSTHILSDVERICDDVAFLNEGQICFSGSIADLKSKHQKQGFELELLEKKDEALVLEKFPNLSLAGDRHLVSNDGSIEDMRRLNAFLLDNKMDFRKLELAEITLENVFMEVTSHE